jgi:secreted trypsin-like serine protease
MVREGLMLKRLLLVAVVAAAALLAPSAATPLIGGEPTGTTSYTNVGAFGVIRDGAFLEICSGTLIAPNVVLTAGHCTVYFEELERSGFDVVFTLDPVPSGTSVVYDAAAFYTHPEYVDRLNGNSKCGLYGQCTTDVGLVELATAPTGVTPATIAPLNYIDTLDLKTQLFNIVGYGVEGFSNANTPLGSDGGTRKVGTFEALGQDVTAARFLKLSGQHYNDETCFGDSGGPVFANGYVVAVVSFGQSWVCASNGYYTRLDTASVSNWISATLATINS